ncbi:hypothetical protein ABZ646_27765 [Streptomyces sp. NPDC007162]|uniref:hypothetical protein n=1 Tax=Streptomyces sp. NPDC007162 TaxID=3156917 RepID=UPI0033F88E09
MRTLAAFSLTALVLLFTGVTTGGALPDRSTGLQETHWAAPAGSVGSKAPDIPLCC